MHNGKRHVRSSFYICIYGCILGVFEKKYNNNTLQSVQVLIIFNFKILCVCVCVYIEMCLISKY